MGGVSDLYDALEEFFGACRTAIAETSAGLPECAYLSEGPPAWDACPCLVAYAGLPAAADTLPLQPSLAPAHRVTTHGQVNLVPLTVIALRCSPQISDDGILPPPSEHAAATREVLEDAWALWNHLAAAKRSGALFAPREREFSLEPGIALNPQGGAAGATVTVRVQLDGYTPS